MTSWWHDAVGYSLYLRSFADSDGDGMGDLGGVLARLDHLADLGVDLLWVTPFYPSPMADHGYDIVDHGAVDPRFGRLADVDRLVDAAHRLGIRVVIDLIPNHTSAEHPWFRQAVDEPTGRYRDYYVWADPAPRATPAPAPGAGPGAGDGSGPPNNWVSYFGGPAWTLDPASGQYYLHLFLASQPDLNWRNPRVVAEFDRIVEFWLDRGIDGFRVDAAQCLVKSADLASNPAVAAWRADAPRSAQWAAFEHRHDVVQPETIDIFERWRTACARRGAVLIGETHVDTAADLARLLPGRGLDAGFWFGAIGAAWDAAEIIRALREPIEAVGDPRRIAWVSSSLDDPRAATRLGGGELGRRRALALATLVFGLPGVPFLYQGEELGLVDGLVPPAQRLDPVAGPGDDGRDGCRTPMPWEPGPSLGFSTSAATWLPMGGRSEADTVAAQRGVEGSWLERFKALVALRRRCPALRSAAPVEWFDPAGGLAGYSRGEVWVAANAGERPVQVPRRGTILFDTDGGQGRIGRSDRLGPGRAVVVRCG
ncbi:MAG: alpha-amylase family glycosyl hydrolase [Acidimicrobiia bacterium]|nr:alpha-amylase family glycosyl hydrolase [Acidimicrobiia bacterium]